jgi:hypothetical protein
MFSNVKWACLAIGIINPYEVLIELSLSTSQDHLEDFRDLSGLPLLNDWEWLQVVRITRELCVSPPMTYGITYIQLTDTHQHLPTLTGGHWHLPVVTCTHLWSPALACSHLHS